MTSTLTLCGGLRIRSVPPFASVETGRVAFPAFRRATRQRLLRASVARLPKASRCHEPPVRTRWSHPWPPDLFRDLPQPRPQTDPDFRPRGRRSRHLSHDVQTSVYVFTVTPTGCPVHKPTTTSRFGRLIDLSTDQIHTSPAFPLPRYSRYFRSSTPLDSGAPTRRRYHPILPASLTFILLAALACRLEPWLASLYPQATTEFHLLGARLMIISLGSTDSMPYHSPFRANNLSEA